MCHRFDAHVGLIGFDPQRRCVRCLRRPPERGTTNLSLLCRQCLTEISGRTYFITPSRGPAPVGPTGRPIDHVDDPDDGQIRAWGYDYRLASGFALLGQGGFGDQLVSRPSFPSLRKSRPGDYGPNDPCEQELARCRRRRMHAEKKCGATRPEPS